MTTFVLFSKTVTLVAIVIIICAAIYGTYWIFKTLSYRFFYEDLVRITINEMLAR